MSLYFLNDFRCADQYPVTKSALPRQHHKLHRKRHHLPSLFYPRITPYISIIIVLEIIDIGYSVEEGE